MRKRNIELIKLAKSSLQLFNNYNVSQPLSEQCKKHNLIATLNQLNFENLLLRSSRQKGIGIFNILLHKSLRSSIYYLPTNQIMKLHNHPKMEVISYILKGKMQAKIYSHIKDKIYQKDVQMLEQKHIQFIDGVRSSKDNLHQFKAIEPTFFLDIIFPDYNQERQCTIFTQQQEISSNQVILKQLKGEYETDFFNL